MIAAWIELLVCWLAWCAAFYKPSRQAKGQEPLMRARSSLLGIGMVFLAFFLVWVWVKPNGFQKSAALLIASMLLGPLSVFLVWASANELGKQWRFEAAVSSNHELIQTGPYRYLRHPIYTSMFGMLMATAAAYTWWPLWVGGALAFIAGTEIRFAPKIGFSNSIFKMSFAATVRAFGRTFLWFGSVGYGRPTAMALWAQRVSPIRELTCRHEREKSEKDGATGVGKAHNSSLNRKHSSSGE